MDSDWASSLDLFLDLDRASGLGRGIERSLREAIRDGRLTPGTALPSSRSLARDLDVARGTVSAAYSQLAAEGYLSARQGAPVRVTWAPPRQQPSSLSPEPPERCQWDFRPGRPDSASFPRIAWARAHRHVLMHAPDEIFDYGDARGRAELRGTLADYLGRARGVDTDPGRLLICNGFTQAFTLVCHALKAAGASTLAVEDPGTPRFRRIAGTLGLRVVSVRCDQEGLRTDLLAQSSADAVLVTPAHQYPLGVTMSAGRRTALIEWARRSKSLIIEDDYDGEFRYDRQPTGALQQLDPRHVIYIGTASKTLGPGLRLGWLSAPRSMGRILATAKEHLDRGTGILDQLTLAELIMNRSFDRHVRRMRASYRRRRAELAQTLAAELPHLRLAGPAAGLHALIYLPEDGPTEHQLRRRAARRSIALHTLAGYWHDPPDPSPQAIIVGYASPATHAYRPALHALAQLLARES